MNLTSKSNPMLDDFRRIVASDPAFDSAQLAAFWIKHWAAVTFAEAAEHIAHARRVLEKLAALA